MDRKKIFQEGLSLIELIVVIALFTILSLVVTTSIHSLYKANAYTFAQAYQLQNARIGVDLMTRDIREMIYADNGSFPLVRMEEHHIAFYSDIDRDDSVEYVEYEIMNDTDLVKRVHNATGTPPVYDLDTPEEEVVISEYVQNYLEDLAVFQYYDENNDEILNSRPTDVRYISLNLIINVDPVRDPGQYMLRASAALRNIK